MPRMIRIEEWSERNDRGPNPAARGERIRELERVNREETAAAVAVYASSIASHDWTRSTTAAAMASPSRSGDSVRSQT